MLPRMAISLKQSARQGWKRNGMKAITKRHNIHSMTQALQLADKADVYIQGNNIQSLNKICYDIVPIVFPLTLLA